MSPPPRALALAAAAGLALLLQGCDDENQRRSEAALRMRSGDGAEVSRGKAELEAFLGRHPSDRVALYALGSYHEKLGHTDEARLYYERLVGTNRDCEEVGRASEALARFRLAASGSAPGVPSPPAAAPSASAPSAPVAPLAIVPGRGLGAGELSIGDTPKDPGRPFGPCESTRPLGEASVCEMPSRGLEIELRDGKIRRIGVYREGREMLSRDGLRRPFRAFRGATREGVEVGMPEAEALARLGAPGGRRAPRATSVGADASVTVELVDFPRRGLTLEIDLTPRGRVVGGIDIPTIEGRPPQVGPDLGKP